MDNEMRFLYSVYPKKPIRNLLSNGRPINSPKTLSLTKEEVLYCMKSGTVYRRFGSIDRNERVTTINLDRLHQKEFVTEEEWKKNNAVVEEPKKEVVEEKPIVVEPTPVVQSEPEVVESTSEEEIKSEEEVNENLDLPAEEVTVEDETDSRGTVVNTEAEVTTEEESEENSESATTLNEFYNNGYHKKKKKH